MLTTTMDQPPCDQTPVVRSPPFQARALHFLKKLALRGRKSGWKSKDTVSPVTIPAQDFQRAHSSVDLLRKPGISPFIGFRVEDGSNPMDTDDSSPDASASGNSPPFRSRRHSTWDSLSSAPTHSHFPGRGMAPLFFRNEGGLRDQVLVDSSGKLPASTPSFLPPSTSLDTGVQPARSALPSSETSPQVRVFPASRPDEEAVQDMPINDPPRPSGDVYPHHYTFTNLLTDLTPSTSSDPGILSRTESLRASEDPTSKAITARPALLPRYSAPLPPPFRVTTERGLRLSPSIITRQPMPLLNLPALPPPPLVPDSPQRQRVPLRSMPSLSILGHSNVERQADHETATLGDSDEADGDSDDDEEFMDAACIHQSDDEDDEPPSTGPSSSQGFMVQNQPMRGDGLSESHISPVSLQSDAVGVNLVDCICSKAYTQSIPTPPSSTSLEIYPLSPSISHAEDVTKRPSLHPDLPTPRARLENKPSLYRVGSRSMVNLGSPRRTERSTKLRGMVGPDAAPPSGYASDTHEESEGSDSEVLIGRLLRRTSMPNFQPISDPPPYPTFGPRPKETRVAPHEDEGRERLPPYSNSLYLIAILPRKMEFSSPGVQAKDRKWRRVVCELEGTAFRVYKCPPGASGAGVLGDWWEKRVGVGDVAGPNPPRGRERELEGQVERPAKLGIDESPTPVAPPTSSERPTSVPPVRQRTGSQSSMTTQATRTSTPRPAKRMSATSFLSPFRSASITRTESSAGGTRRPQPQELELLPVDTQDHHSLSSQESTGRATPAAGRLSQPPPPRSASRLTLLSVGTSRTQWRNGETVKPSDSDLIRTYTLQHAESGLGNDYLKRKNVIRVRLEGEQFLLQAPDVPAVVEWIEGLHAGTNIALDIDLRPMPRGPMFPRRRRRRVRRTQEEDTSGQRPSGS